MAESIKKSNFVPGYKILPDLCKALGIVGPVEKLVIEIGVNEPPRVHVKRLLTKDDAVAAARLAAGCEWHTEDVKDVAVDDKGEVKAVVHTKDCQGRFAPHGSGAGEEPKTAPPSTRSILVHWEPEGGFPAVVLSEVAPACPLNHERLEGRCQRIYCSCRCAKCEKDCAEGK